MNNKINSIHLLRGLAGIFVVFYHFRGYLNGVYVQRDLGQILFGSAAFGVDLFFMISGFIIALSTKKITTNAVFAIRRFFRIYPAFFVVFVIGVITVYRYNPSENLLRAFFFIHRDYSIDSPGFGYNVLGPAWTLTYEIYFYTLFATAMSLSHKYRTLITSVLLITPVFILQTYFNGSISLSGGGAANIPLDSPIYGFLRFVSSPIILEFVVGMVFYEIYSRVSFTISPSASLFVLLSCCGIFFTYYFSGSFNGFGLDKAGAISAILLFGFLFYDKFVGFKLNPFFEYLGDVSFSIYISHYFFINFMNFYNPELYTQTSGISRILLMLTITMIAGTLLHFGIERRFITIGKGLESRIVRTKIYE
ncbi:TPA: acyltransferase [Enterobacter kobei]|nr:acyltransferase [Enterobacter kobei]